MNIAHSIIEKSNDEFITIFVRQTQFERLKYQFFNIFAFIILRIQYSDMMLKSLIKMICMQKINSLCGVLLF